MSIITVVSGKVISSIADLGLEAAGYGLPTRLLAGVGTELIAEGLFHGKPIFLIQKERQLLDRAREDFSHSAFPLPDRVNAALEDVRRRAIAMSGRAETYDRFLKDKIDIAAVETETGVKRLAGDIESKIGKIRINCTPSSSGAILMSERARQRCPIVEYEIAPPVGSDQMPRVLNTEPEIAILSNAGFLASSRNELRKKYVLYAPLHRSLDFLMVKAGSSSRLKPLHQEVKVIPQSSGEERQRMGRIDEGFKYGGYVDAHTSSQLRDQLDESQAVPAWDPLSWGLVHDGFRRHDIGTDATWISIFVRRDLFAKHRQTTEKRRAIVGLLAGVWRELTISKRAQIDVIRRAGEYRAGLTIGWSREQFGLS